MKAQTDGHLQTISCIFGDRSTDAEDDRAAIGDQADRDWLPD